MDDKKIVKYKMTKKDIITEIQERIADARNEFDFYAAEKAAATEDVDARAYAHDMQYNALLRWDTLERLLATIEGKDYGWDERNGGKKQ